MNPSGIRAARTLRLSTFNPRRVILTDYEVLGLNTNRLFLVAGFLSVVLPFHLGCSTSAQNVGTPTLNRLIVGQLKLPTGDGSRGIQVIIEVTNDESTYSEWLSLDKEFKFRKSFIGTVKKLEIVSGIDGTLHTINAQGLARLTKTNNVDVGAIDLVERLRTNKIKLLSESAPTLRIGMWFEKPPADVSLGSRQFPEIAAGMETNWLLPSEFDTVYFLVEKPADKRRGRDWRSGKQKLFGPFPSSELPTELTIE